MDQQGVQDFALLSVQSCPGRLNVRGREREAVIAQEHWRNVSTLFFFRGKGSCSMHEYRRWIEPRARTFSERLLFSAVARCPGILANYAAYAVVLVSGRYGRLAKIQLTASPFYFGRWPNARPQ